MRAPFDETAAFDVLNEVLEERYRQHGKWGEQNHPDGTGPTTGDNERPVRGVFSAKSARVLCDLAAKDGSITYGHILVEEVAEALEEVDPAKLREELVQVAAVAVAWIEAIDRRREKSAAEGER